VGSEKLVSIAQNPTMIGDADFAVRVLKLHDQLDDYPDTVNVFTNFEISDEVLEQLGE
jgi:transcriptional/translational regulatory protein YebC/TACO1